jgi:hypothetical protein
MRAGLFWPNDGQWARIEPHLPTGLTGPDRDDDRRIISGIIHIKFSLDDDSRDGRSREAGGVNGRRGGVSRPSTS